MKRVEFCLPADVNLGDMEWFEPQPDAKLPLHASLRGVLSEVRS